MVRDNAIGLGKAIQSIRPAVDRVIVMDTGSVDETNQIARSLADHVIEFPWPGRFDYALNRLLAEVKDGWILRLDADEWFEDKEAESILSGRYAQYLNSEIDVFVLNRREIHPGYDDIITKHPRLFRADRGFIYKGRVHERLNWDEVQGIAQTEIDLTINHLSIRSQEKYRMYLELSRQDALENSECFDERSKYVEMLICCEEPNAVDELWKLYFELFWKVAWWIDQYYYGAYICSQALDNTDGENLDDVHIRHLALVTGEFFPDVPMCVHSLAVYHLRRCEWDQAGIWIGMQDKLSEGGYNCQGDTDPEIFSRLLSVIKQWHSSRTIPQ